MFDHRLHAAVVAIIVAAGPTGSRAADLPSRRDPAPVVAVPVFTWTGFYVGANAGGAFGSGAAATFSDPTFATNVTGSGGGTSAFVGGGQVGYNYQFGAGSGVVVGVEADFQGVAGGSRATYAIGTVPFYDVAPSLDWFGTVRGRIGYAFERLLVYGTGGFAYGGGKLPTLLTTSYPYTLPDTTRTGYAVGGGVEYAFTRNISVKLEGLYVDLERRTATTYYDALSGGYYGTTGRDSGFGVVRAGLNYRF